MGKRSNFKRRKNDAYDTPYKGFLPLIPHLVPGATYTEPCAGKGILIDHLMINGFRCVAACDIEPREKSIKKMDAINLSKYNNCYSDYIITNPPWTAEILHPMIEVFRNITTTWLLLDADWKHTKQAIPYMEYCSLVVSVGRVKWIPDSKHVGKSNAAWYRFGKDKAETIFKARE